MITHDPTPRPASCHGTIRRRDLLKGAAALPLLAWLPEPLSRLSARAPAAGDEGVLVVVQLTGGNDGLNTIVPWADDAYHRARPVLAVPESQVHKLDDHSGLHPALSALVPLWDEGLLGIVQGVGYPDPVRSHFRSMEVWHTARTDESPPTAGWLGRAVGRLDQAGLLPAARLGGHDLPLAVAGAPSQVPALSSLGDLALHGAAGRSGLAVLQDECGAAAGREGEAEWIARAYASAFDCARRLGELRAPRAETGAPGGKLQGSLGLAAQLIGAGLGARVLYVTQGSYDTHAQQAKTQARLLRELAAALAGFQARLAEQGDDGRVVTLVFSEFGRRIEENASAGTDHGAGNPVLLLGRPVRGGLHGERPDLSAGAERDVPVTTDFRTLYAAAIRHLGLAPGDVIEGGFAPAAVLG